jgi:16S rRNA (cytidine1402-2'-O)-methyltransferase
LLPPGLYIAATPIGHARDITLRTLDTLRACDVIAAEDTRVTAKLLAIYGISKTLVSYNEHNAARERPRLLARIQAGERVVLVSDAGTPLVSDPGFKLVREAVAMDLRVEALPGASAALVSLVLSGLPSDRFLFAGFLPTRSGERRTALGDVAAIRASLIFFESPHRLAESLQDLAAVLGDRPAAVCRELTKFHQDVRRGTLLELAARYAGEDEPRGEISIVVGPPETIGPQPETIDSLLKQALAFMPVRAAADLVSEALGLTRRGVYDRALALKDAGDG